MPDPEPQATDTDVPDDLNRRIAALLLVAILVVTFVVIAAGQVFAASNACGEPGHGDADVSQPQDFALAGRDFAMTAVNRNDRAGPRWA